MSAGEGGQAEILSAEAELIQQFGFNQIIGQSPAVRSVINDTRCYARSQSPVLILGESGVGKELFAHAIHYCGPRTAKPFVPVNCSAIPADLFENEFFGHARGAFTGATSDYPGLFEQADGGTLFLDEVNSLALPNQPKLLRAIQCHEARRLGSSTNRKFDVRVICASNADLKSEVRVGRFREDLYYRLEVLKLKLPPLREHREDIPLLANHCLQRHVLRLNALAAGSPVQAMGSANKYPVDVNVATSFTPFAIEKLVAYHWPGNVRELENVIERALILCNGPSIDAPDLQFDNETTISPALSLKAQKKQANYNFEHQRLTELLQEHHGNIRLAAKACQTERRTFYGLVRKHNLLSDSS